MNFTQPIPLSLYVHYPWCVQKCPYCDFNSHTLAQDQEKRYIQALIRQLEQILPRIWGRPIQSIFFGGGTPSLMSEAGLAHFLSHARALLGFQPDIEITLEANPGTVDSSHFIGFREAGVNRLSMGIQSFEDEKLKALGRIHSANEAHEAVEKAKAAGFKNFNLDLMFALPNQTIEQAQQDVRIALDLAPTHLSHYQLTLEPNTPFYKNPPVLPDDDLAWEIQQSCQAQIAQAGYAHYEVSAYAKNHQACLHNLNYWQFGDYIGLGAGAHGKITNPPKGEIWRSQMPASPGSYMQLIETDGLGKWDRLTDADAIFEFMLNALRLQQGFDLALFEHHTGLPLTVIEPKILEIQDKKWAKRCENRLQLTAQGQTFLNEVTQLFLP